MTTGAGDDSFGMFSGDRPSNARFRVNEKMMRRVAYM
jgi:hypothetical protein